MSKTTYTIRGSNTTTAIKYAPIIIQNIWRAGTDAGANIIRVRVAKERDEKTKGRTFFGYHQNKVSIYQQLQDPIFPLWFRRKVKLGESNKGMQVLEVANNMDSQKTFNVIDNYEAYTNSAWTRFTERLKDTLLYSVSLFQR
jgi:hypothetical protein